MTSLVRKIALLISVFGAMNSASARAVSWQESVRLAEENNADLKSAEATYRATENLEGVARSGFLPSVTGSLDATRNVSNQYSASVTGSQNLFAGFSDRAALNRAKANTRAAEAAYRIAKAKVSFDLKSSFEGLLYAQSVRLLSADIVKRRESNLELVQLSFESGRENKGSVLLSKAYLNQAKYEALQADNNTSIARYELARVIGIDDSDEAFTAVGEVPVSTPHGDHIDFQKIAAETPDHVQAVAQEASSDAAVSLARGTFYPSLDFTATYGRKNVIFFPNGPDRWTLGLSLTIPLFSGLKDYYSTKSSLETYAASIGNRVGVDRELLVKLRTAYHGCVEAIMKAEVDASFRDAAQLRAEIARTKYNNGLLTFEDWDLIENDLIVRQKNFLQSMRDRVTAEAAWEQAQGIGVIP